MSRVPAYLLARRFFTAAFPGGILPGETHMRVAREGIREMLNSHIWIVIFNFIYTLFSELNFGVIRVSRKTRM